MAQWQRRKLGVGSLSVIAVSSLMVILSPMMAYAGILDGWYTIGSGPTLMSEAYFSNGEGNDTNTANRFGCGFTRCPVLPNGDYAYDAFNSGYYHGGDASIAASVSRARQLVVDLKARNALGGWDQAGASFIVNTMLGHGIDSPAKSRTITAAMWTDLENRLVDRALDNRIDWNIDFSSNGKDTYVRRIRNTDGVIRWDVVYDATVQTRNGLRIYNDDGTVGYQLWYLCANPVGDMNGVQPAPPFDLEPTISVSPGHIESGGSADITATIRNNDSGTSDTAQWQVTRFVRLLGASGSMPTGGTSPSGTPPTAYYGNGAVVIDSGSGTFTSSSPALPVEDYTIGDYPVGTRICFTLSVNPYERASTDWRHSNPFCVVIAKSPKLQVLGGDVLVGKEGTAAITTSSIRKTVSGSPRTFGSWGEYGVAASGIITGMASGSGYSASGAPSASFCSVSLLTFSNGGTGLCNDGNAKGNYDLGTALPDISSRFTPTNTAGATFVINPATPSRVYTRSGNITITSASDVGVGRWIVINVPNHTVRINDNITYTSSTLNSVDDIPQVIIIANQILIDESVTRVDAWLIASGATGRINTCAQITNPAAQLNESRCNSQLTINGPVAARQLLLYRTAGAGTGAQSGDPAEVFNFRPDAYIWANNYNSSNGRLQTITTRELPPRF